MSVAPICPQCAAPMTRLHIPPTFVNCWVHDCAASEGGTNSCDKLIDGCRMAGMLEHAHSLQGIGSGSGELELAIKNGAVEKRGASPSCVRHLASLENAIGEIRVVGRNDFANEVKAVDDFTHPSTVADHPHESSRTDEVAA